MSKQYQVCVIISYINLLNAASISMKSLSTVKPSTLLLPPGFDSQLPPLQPMLYPFAVAISAESTRPPSMKNLPIISPPAWIPMSSQTKENVPLIPTAYSSPSTSSPFPILEDRITQYDEPPLSSSNDNGPVFESIVYGTWKPDPPLQPADILNATKQQLDSGLVADGKFYNKTINRQHGGFIGHIQQKPLKNHKNENVVQNNNEKTSLSSSSIEYRSNEESAELNFEEKTRKIKKQGRQKIRPNTITQQQLSIVENGAAASTEPTTTQIQQTVIKVNADDPQLLEVVKQINESIEIKYNHKQTSPHSIEMTTDNDDERWRLKKVSSATVTTSSSDQLQTEEDELDNTSVTRMNWPTDFMNTPLSPTSEVTIMPQQSREEDATVTSSSVSSETEHFELPLALSALHIPQSLWPKLPGNITKFGLPYEADNSEEEPALCVPITVREPNMIDSNEIVLIERVFCFPMPSTTVRANLKDMRSSSTSSTVTKAKVQNFDDFIDSNVKNISSNLESQIYLLTYILVIYFKFIY